MTPSNDSKLDWRDRAIAESRGKLSESDLLWHLAPGVGVSAQGFPGCMLPEPRVAPTTYVPHGDLEYGDDRLTHVWKYAASRNQVSTATRPTMTRLNGTSIWLDLTPGLVLGLNWAHLLGLLEALLHHGKETPVGPKQILLPVTTRLFRDIAGIRAVRALISELLGAGRGISSLGAWLTNRFRRRFHGQQSGS